MKRYLLLEDGTSYEGYGYGYDGEASGEIVFTTSMSGYVETITDPSYAGEILIFAFPEIANYSISMEHMESDKIQVSGIITRDAHAFLNGGDPGKGFNEFLKANKIPAIDGIDTRELVEKIRQNGTVRAYIGNKNEFPGSFPDPMKLNLVGTVSRKNYQYYNSGRKKEILFVDVGTKNSLVKRISETASLHIVPYNYDFDSIKFHYDAIFLPNGPGDPDHESLEPLRGFIREKSSEMPVIGVCLGNQLIALSLGGKTEKMKYGHRGINHAVLIDGRVYITSHNHGYAVNGNSLGGTGLEVAGRDINDGTVEMIRHRELPVFSVQFHPEAYPGPYDSTWFFNMVRNTVGE
ncbi:MAG: glutamine-hydrolyzing carbamoyl-phosphate synthase small subunit [Ferroplasma sp.]|uniref:glutamine-hydrolyzing carbamoyl-phosphate synthase small subunit n=1 Tax=Ferroplasma sp. TaxID=2591003 RepID=UPI002814C2E1|nr:glutamine-hydrolyzing carbamoyl-phosphate synthase small subunit [Ferroplasma sp.]WMT50956.1 MAG: glutamine-hydrolyzing carbamoyl-phosphate synthase small subunit [Ferroplasma sp.]